MYYSVENLGPPIKREDTLIYWKFFSALNSMGYTQTKLLNGKIFIALGELNGENSIIRGHVTEEVNIDDYDRWFYKNKKEALKAFKQWDCIGEPPL